MSLLSNASHYIHYEYSEIKNNYNYYHWSVKVIIRVVDPGRL